MTAGDGAGHQSDRWDVPAAPLMGGRERRPPDVEDARAARPVPQEPVRSRPRRRSMHQDFTAGAVIARAFEIYRDQFGVLVGTALLVFAVEALASLTLPGGLAIVAAVVSIILTTFYQGMVVALVHDVQDGRRDNSVGDLLRGVSPVVLPLLIVSFLAGVGIGIGFLLLIVPGLFLLTIWAVAAPVCVLERPGVFASFGRSRELVRGHGWTVFAALVLVFLIVLAAGIVAGIVGLAFGGGDAPQAIVGWVLNAMVQPLAALTAAVLYFALRPREPAAEPDATYGGFAPPV